MNRETRFQEREVSSAATAQGYVRRMVEMECRGWGDQENAVMRLARKYHLSFWTMMNLKTGRAKTVEASIFEKIRGAYFDLVNRQIENLQHELATERALRDDATLENLEHEAAALAARLKAAREAAMK